MSCLVLIEQALDRRLVARVERGRRAPGRPGLVDAAVLRTGGVRPHRRGMDERGHIRRSGGGEYAPAALHVYSARCGAVARRLDQPCEMDDRIGAAEVLDEVVVHHVSRNPARLRALLLGAPARDCRNARDLRIGFERVEDAGADVARGSGYDQMHLMALRPPGGSLRKRAQYEWA